MTAQLIGIHAWTLRIVIPRRGPVLGQVTSGASSFILLGDPSLTTQSRDTWDKPPEEREFLRRLDSCLILYATLSYLSKSLDQQNVTVSIHLTISSRKPDNAL